MDISNCQYCGSHLQDSRTFPDVRISSLLPPERGADIEGSSLD